MSYAFPHQFRLSEYICSWLASPDRDEDGEETGGLVCVRVAHTGDDSLDWSESDLTADTLTEAMDLARALIAEHEDARRENTNMQTDTVLTAETISHEQIRALRAEAAAAGDMDQVAICDRALGGTDTADDYTTISRSLSGRLDTMTEKEAQAECARAIMARRACDELTREAQEDGMY